MDNREHAKAHGHGLTGDIAAPGREMFVLRRAFAFPAGAGTPPGIASCHAA